MSPLGKWGPGCGNHGQPGNLPNCVGLICSKGFYTTPFPSRLLAIFGPVLKQTHEPNQSNDHPQSRGVILGLILDRNLRTKFFNKRERVSCRIVRGVFVRRPGGVPNERGLGPAKELGEGTRGSGNLMPRLAGSLIQPR